MNLKLIHLSIRSLMHYRAYSLYQFMIILFLSAILTGSIFTGKSVKESLKDDNLARLNGTGLLVSSGSRFMPVSLPDRLELNSNESCEGTLELKGWVRNFNTGESALNIQLFGVNNSFFSFTSNPKISLNKGEVAINSKLAKKLGLKSGDDVIVRTNTLSDIPSSSPFASQDDSFESLVMTVKFILRDSDVSDFSLGINQVRPMNVFIPLSEFDESFDNEPRINRILIKHSKSSTVNKVIQSLNEVFTPNDAGLKIRYSETSEQYEIISNRIFISQTELNEVLNNITGARPVITWLINNFSLGNKSTPYSFISALSKDLYDNIPEKDEIVIGEWLAEDLNAKVGDTINLSYFVSGVYKDLVENTHKFVIAGIIKQKFIWADQTLMPEFPGISGSSSCSNWDAGVPIDLDKIRQKDEDYWYDFKGTPKAFINYNTGQKLWGNNFGPATAIRFPKHITEEEIIVKLSGRINPFTTGLRITNLHENALTAAKNSVDFTSLFLSMSIFIILSGMILLILLISTHIETRKKQISTLRALGFSNNGIRRLLFLESGIIAFAGSLAGVFAGFFFNILTIESLNSVWKGAVQTDTLRYYFDVYSLVTGFIVTFSIVVVVQWFMLRSKLKQSVKKLWTGKNGVSNRNSTRLFYFLCILLLVSFIINPWSVTLSWFISGTLLFLVFILFFRYIINIKSNITRNKSGRIFNPSWQYYRQYPSRAISPIIFLASGLFIVIIAGANRKSFNSNTISNESGTGGYLLWAETATSLLYDLNSRKGNFEYDILLDDLPGLHFTQAKRIDGDDASCLNLNSAGNPPILGINAETFTQRGSFSFASRLKGLQVKNPWDALLLKPGERTIYGIVDQTVLQWSLYKKPGDTLIVSTETGEPLNIIISGGMKSSIFQGHILIGIDHFNQFYPSVSGSNIFLADGNLDSISVYKSLLSDKLSSYGVELDYTYDKLASFQEVSNTYLMVFVTLGGLGMIMGVLGLGFVLMRNFNLRKKEYALNFASGYPTSTIRKSIFLEHVLILLAGVLAGSIPALIATMPSLLSDAQLPISLLLAIILTLLAVVTSTLFISVKRLVNKSIVNNLNAE